ncbi:hypothetical protein POM88_028216 [Heracleum sosnowskyi]|uniref:Peptidase M3A/M3B catalytic domain-containing protein n=1 Tax=Heracleum sosnowskyi TaxID=360622 RepID=A0AAD8I925_9APIA|nr:hypothetical protein POM88_028216 [Heracleum sosnowskyi]
MDIDEPMQESEQGNNTTNQTAAHTTTRKEQTKKGEGDLVSSVVKVKWSLVKADYWKGELVGFSGGRPEGKYGHACVVPLQCGSSHDDARQIPVALLTSQFQKYVDGGSGLLRFSKVVGLFHEFGHVTSLASTVGFLDKRQCLI